MRSVTSVTGRHGPGAGSLGAFAFGAGLSLVLPPPWVDAAVELDMAGTTILQTGTKK